MEEKYKLKDIKLEQEKAPKNLQTEKKKEKTIEITFSNLNQKK